MDQGCSVIEMVVMQHEREKGLKKYLDQYNKSSDKSGGEALDKSDDAAL
jgi:hypothetical protein